ncbi:cyclic nucleotide-binding protein [Methylovirgula ligni]|uniref:Cyclic nucleotide-binding protein n=1 Tax=Methylovirgula ligni TaxID=569860 RepID=A0A3D9Z303_9HYPH|nr:cyclic nucleotide-binding domain-containing protein [Methylovirgula ligni]QAY95160.1 cyclic nucleotide-binding protein [Methylovirgula ligni]REF89554.1 cyclic nucleotide-binding protein [Methylovirgula ligni]
MARDDDLHDLTRHPVLAALEPEALRFLLREASQRILRSGEILFRRDEPSDGGYFLRSGSVVLEATEPGRDEKIVRPPTLIGEMALIAPTRRPATAVAREPSGVLQIPRSLFQRALAESPRSAERLRRLLEKRLHGFAQELNALRESAFEDHD